MIDSINNPIKENWIGWYLICLTLPFSTIYVVGYVRPYELAILYVLISIFINLDLIDNNYKRLTSLDKVILIYACYMLVSVVVGVSDIYESLRAYRYQVLSPVLIYMCIRLLPFSLNTITRAHVIMVAVVIVQTLIVIAIYIEEGRRPKGVSHELVGTIVKYSLLSSYVLLFLFFTWSSITKNIWRLLTLAALVVIAGGVLTSASRGVVLPTVAMLLLTPFVWRRKYNRMIMAVSISVSLVLLVLLIAFAPPKFDYDEGELLDDARSVERVTNIDGYMMDITGRVQYWSYIFEESMEHPIFGYGAAAVDISSTDIGKRHGHNPHHPHNVLMGMVVVSGLVGLLVMLSMLFYMFQLLVHFRAIPGPLAAYEKMLLAWSVVFIVTALTNGIQGGIVMLMFFVMGLMQQVVLYGKYHNDQPNDNDKVSVDDTVGNSDLRILRKAGERANSTNILSHKIRR